jgi:RNA polymerase sigma-70 factor (ECF subfamily)
MGPLEKKPHSRKAVLGIMGRKRMRSRRRMPVLGCKLENDATLLQRYANGREEAAFEELVERHGPLVLRVCRRFLQSEHDVEDVFQGSFLLLANKAAEVSWEASVAGWLHAVARRLSLKTRTGSSRWRSCENLIGDVEARSDALDELERTEIRRVLDEALCHLPEKYRVPVELCYLEGKSHAEAARQLGWPAGSMSRRLHRARSILRQRLARSGLIVAGLIAAAAVLFQMPHTASPDPSARSLVRHAMQSLRESSEGQVDWQSVLATVARGQQHPGDQDYRQVEELGRKARRVAAEIADHDPGNHRERWVYHVARMQRAAVDLSTAARRSDQIALIAAARRLDATCVNCHEVFRGRTGVSAGLDSGLPAGFSQF